MNKVVREVDDAVALVRLAEDDATDLLLHDRYFLGTRQQREVALAGGGTLHGHREQEAVDAAVTQEVAPISSLARQALDHEVSPAWMQPIGGELMRAWPLEDA